ncbi:hypothetical protein QFZ53_003096 [Microbacterium natoriense]|uniref:DUF2809 domain-containing protein n=1 Tax=Microbacterium natoriense TaxID=284570 RepID=A0AAW8EZG6_9MICO|nr:DUF2809 domain-containing protein [Microbacterium natoriense]MDQ0648900.1 hypothetical protein [Microbacterium natoriense]
MTSPPTVVTRRRTVLAGLAVLVVATGLLVHRFVGGQLGDIAGDALYAVLIYLIAAFALPRSPGMRPALIALVFCTGVELLQLTGLPQVWAAAFPPSALVLGSGFDPRDLVVYALAVIVAAAADALLAKTSRSTPVGHATGRPPEGERPV